VPVIPHSHQSHNAHLIVAHTNSPLIEYFPTGVHRTGYTLFTELFDGEPEVSDGWVILGEEPGLGITLNEDALARYARAGTAHV
jgi:L-alanine-DL-glutamate epimerase-like enolase superfamily enzyme